MTVVAGRHFGKTTLLQQLHGLHLPEAWHSAGYVNGAPLQSLEVLAGALPAPPQPGAKVRQAVLVLDDVAPLLLDGAVIGSPLVRLLQVAMPAGCERVILFGRKTRLAACRALPDQLSPPVAGCALGPITRVKAKHLVYACDQAVGISVVLPDEINTKMWKLPPGNPAVFSQAHSWLSRRAATGVLDESGQRSEKLGKGDAPF